MDFLRNELIAILLGMMPISEVRGSIPYGLLYANFSPIKAYLLAVFGNILPVLPLLFFLEKIAIFLTHKYYFFNRFFTWLFEHTKEKHRDHFHYWKFMPLALFMFVAVPFPLTGAWSGAVAAIIFGVPIRTAAMSIISGILVSAGIVLVLSLLGSGKLFF
jgi:uncharacterized membrane protein